jgi:hypothetical protein
VFRDGFVTVAIGLALGLAAAAVAMALLRGAIAGLENPHGAAIGASALMVTAAAAIACFVPARWRCCGA